MSPSASSGSAIARPSAAYTATSVSDCPVQKSATAAEARCRVRRKATTQTAGFRTWFSEPPSTEERARPAHGERQALAENPECDPEEEQEADGAAGDRGHQSSV